MNQPVIIPKTPRSVYYHRPGCEKVDDAAGARLAEQDAEAIGRKPAPCMRRVSPPDQDPDRPPEVPA